MGNPYDQFDKSPGSRQAANPYDQFDAPTGKPPPASGGQNTLSTLITGKPAEDNSFLGRAARAIDPGPFIKAVPQGILGIPEAIYQYAEHVAPNYVPHPGHWADPLRRYQQQSESTWGGLAGETVGNVAGFAAGGELADLLRLGGAARAFITSPATRARLATLLQSQVAQPTQGDDFWTQKGESAGLAYLLGKVLGRSSQQASHDVATATNKAATEADAADARAAKQAAANALSDPNHPINLALNARKARIDAKAAVPADTTSGWWHRTLQQIGVADPTLTRAAPATGAKVRDVVGGRRNEIIGRMELNSGDPNFTEQIHDIRDEVMRDLPESAQTKFYKPPPEQDLASPIINPVTGKPFARATPATLGAPGKATGDWVRTVEEPLAKGNLSGRQLSDYISRLGARAEELAKLARVAPQDQRAEMYAMSNAYRQVADAVVGRAAGSPEDKLALEAANRAYTMWSVANDAALASRNGVATPRQLIESMKRRLGGEARYEQALNNPDSPYHDMTNWLQSQLEAHTTRVPSAAEVRAGVPPTPAAAPPAPRPQVPVPKPARRPTRSPLKGLAQAGGAGLMYAMGHPLGALYTGERALRNIFGHGAAHPEGRTEQWLRELLTRDPRAVRPATATAGTVAAQTPRIVPPKVRKPVEKIGQAAADALGRKAQAMYYSWGPSQ